MFYGGIEANVPYACSSEVSLIHFVFFHMTYEKGPDEKIICRAFSILFEQ